ncbi:MAG TPA: flagellar biosynthesis protein FlgI, partial [Limnobacter sp.]|nr:flagellar biosynthesis protein FlgI [Limnobacter sp.]
MKRISFPELKDRIIKAAVLALTAAAVMAFGTQADAQTRIRDLVTVSGVR